MHIVSLFCEIDDFFLALAKHQAEYPRQQAEPPETWRKKRRLHHSEIMTILINFHQSPYRTFKEYYQRHVCVYLRWAFPTLVSYNRFVELKKEVLGCLSLYLYIRLGTCDGISFIKTSESKTPLLQLGDTDSLLWTGTRVYVEKRFDILTFLWYNISII